MERDEASKEGEPKGKKLRTATDDDPLEPLSLIIEKGHVTNYCIFLKAKHDKIQLLEVSTAQCIGATVMPKDVVEHLTAQKCFSDLIKTLPPTNSLKDVDKEIKATMRNMLREWRDAYIKSKMAT